MRRILLACTVLALACFAFSGVAQATCSGVITSITVLEGGPAVHITAINPVTCANVAPGEISLVPGNNGLTAGCTAGYVGPSGTKITYAPDSTGISLSPVAGATGMGPCNENLTFTDGTQVLTTPLLMQFNSGVTSIQAATSP